MEKQILEDLNKSIDLLQEDLDNGIIHLFNFNGVQKVKSIRRAIRKGKATIFGDLLPKRPFNNRKNTCRRKGHYSRQNTNIKLASYGRTD